VDYPKYHAEEHLIDVLLRYLSNDIKNRITTIDKLFVRDNIIDLSILSADSTLVKAKGHVWHTNPQ
jgi:hypothetical protein